MADKSINDITAGKANKANQMKDVAAMGAKAVPGGDVPGKVNKLFETFTKPEKRKKTIWVVLAGCGCCVAPFLIGLVLGIATITTLCDKYTTFNRYKTVVINTMIVLNPIKGATLYSLDKAIDVLGTEKAQKAYEKVPQAIRKQLPFSYVMLFAKNKTFFDNTCGSSLNYSGGNGLPCGTFAEIVEKYVGKGAEEMRQLMTAADFLFHPGLWCADSVAFFVSQMGYTTNDFWYSHTNGWIDRFRSGKDGWRLLNDGETPQPGDVAMAKDGHHTCMVYQLIDNSHFYCFGGNQGGGRVTKDSYRTTSQWYFGRLPGR